jgi:3-oxocholest-4-en-26-oate---CoA ligase
VPEFNLADLFELVVDTVPDRTALVAGRVRLSYAELDARANRVGNYLIGLGLPTGSSIGILARNRSEWLEAMIGCFKARMVPVNVNYRYIASELAYLVGNADIELLVVEDDLVGLAEQSLALAPAQGDGASRGCRLLVIEEGGAAVGTDGLGPTSTAAVTGYDRWQSALATSSDDAPGRPRSADDHYVLYTGGTTGQPKGVVWRQEDIFFAAMGGGGWGAVPIMRPEQLVDRIPTGDRSGAVMLVTAPLMHGNAQWATWSGLFMGGTVVLYTEPAYDGATVMRLISDEHVVSVALVGDAMARPLAEALASAPPGTYDTSTLFAIGSGGAMLSAAVKEELAALLPGVVIMDRFGASESGAHGAVEHGAQGPTFTMGPDTTVLDEDLRPLAPGDGRIGRLARSGRIPLGYHKDPVKTAVTFPKDADGIRWSIPGDLASIEPDGTITVHGRGSASINSGGEKIFPEEVESAIKSHPDVFDAIVVGIPDDRFGERVAAVIRTRRPGTPVALEDIQDHCRRLIAGYKVPRQLLLVDDIPLTAAGKPDAKAARALFVPATPGTSAAAPPSS